MRTQWALLNKNRVRNGQYASENSDGFNGMFLLTADWEPVRVIARTELDAGTV